MDLPALNALLRVNGLTKESAPENISDALLRSGFTSDEVPGALAILQGAPATPNTSIPGAYVGSIIEHTRTSGHIEGHASIFEARLGIRQFWLGTVLTFLLYGLTFILVEISAVPIFSLISGISLFAPPDLATAPMRVLLLFGVGMAMLILPALFFLFVSAGLQVRRCHDYGLSGPTWFMAMLALGVGGYLLYQLTPLAAGAVAISVIAWSVLVSWPGSADENVFGIPDPYPSLWGMLCGCFDETENFFGFAKRYLVPLGYLEVTGIALGLCVTVVVPQLHLPSFEPPVTQSAPPNTLSI